MASTSPRSSSTAPISRPWTSCAPVPAWSSSRVDRGWGLANAARDAFAASAGASCCAPRPSTARRSGGRPGAHAAVAGGDAPGARHPSVGIAVPVPAPARGPRLAGAMGGHGADAAGGVFGRVVGLERDRPVMLILRLSVASRRRAAAAAPGRRRAGLRGLGRRGRPSPACRSTPSVRGLYAPTMNPSDTAKDLLTRAAELRPLLERNAARGEEDRRIAEESIDALADAGPVQDHRPPALRRLRGRHRHQARGLRTPRGASSACSTRTRPARSPSTLALIPMSELTVRTRGSWPA